MKFQNSGKKRGGLVLRATVILAIVGQPLLGETVFPGASWAFKTPADVGMDSAKLDQIATTIGGTGCIVRNGYMVKTWGSQAGKGDWASASKPVFSTLLFFAIEEGRLSGVDALVRDQGWSLSVKDQAMTFSHMANMVGNYTRAEAPGAAWAYNDYNIQLYAKTLFERVYGQAANTVALDPARLGPLQFQDGSLFGSTYRLTTSVRDFSRIGWFWANRGNWNGTQLLPQHYFDDYMKPHVAASLPNTSATDPAGDYLGIGTIGGGSDQTPYGPGIYGFNWWFNGKGGLHPNAMTWPDAPPDTFQANGHWGKEVVTIMPSLGIVMSYFQGATLGFTPGSSASSTNQVLKLLAGSVLPTAPLISVDATQFARTVDLGESPTADAFAVWNGGTSTLAYQIAVDQPWLNAVPANGSSDGEHDAISVSYDTSELSAGTYAAIITVSDNGSAPPASNGSQTINVSVTVKTVLPDLDLDGDVDIADFGHLQRCLSMPGYTDPPECTRADITADLLIDQADITAFIQCFSGPDIRADKTCDDSLE